MYINKYLGMFRIKIVIFFMFEFYPQILITS